MLFRGWDPGIFKEMRNQKDIQIGNIWNQFGILEIRFNRDLQRIFRMIVQFDRRWPISRDPEWMWNPEEGQGPCGFSVLGWKLGWTWQVQSLWLVSLNQIQRVGMEMEKPMLERSFGSTWLRLEEDHGSPFGPSELLFG
ncbi:unnamed protein product [Brassica rapa subsp. trilocularis]